MSVTTVDGVYKFYVSPGTIFSYSVVNSSTYAATYREVSEIGEMLKTLFTEGEIIDIDYSMN